MNQQSSFEDEKPTAGQGVQVERALDLLEWLAAAEGKPQGLSEIALGLGQPKATVQPAAGGTAQAGATHIRTRSPGTYWASSASSWATTGHRPLTCAPSPAPTWSSSTRSWARTVQLAIYDQGDVVYVDKLQSTQLVIARPEIGNRAPATVVATGRALLAFQPAADIKALLSRPLPTYTEHTPTSPEEITELLAQVRRDGFASNRETYRKGICGLGGPDPGQHRRGDRERRHPGARAPVRRRAVRGAPGRDDPDRTGDQQRARRPDPADHDRPLSGRPPTPPAERRARGAPCLRRRAAWC